MNVEYGVVYLRGEVPDREQMDALVDRTRKVDGVRGVENLTHLPNEAAPTKDEASQGAGSAEQLAVKRAPRASVGSGYARARDRDAAARS